MLPLFSSLLVFLASQFLKAKCLHMCMTILQFTLHINSLQCGILTIQNTPNDVVGDLSVYFNTDRRVCDCADADTLSSDTYSLWDY